MEPKKLKGSILYIEDEIDAISTMMEFLSLRGLTVTTAFTTTSRNCRNV